MMAKVVLTLACLLFVCYKAESRAVSMYDLQPAKLISNSISKPQLGGPPVFKNCSKSTDLFKLVNVIVGGCTTPPCPLVKGTNVSVEIDFTAEAVEQGITSKVYGDIAGVMVPFPLTSPDACKDATSGVECPTKVGGFYKYHYSLPVSEEYPSLKLVVYWYMYDPSGKEELCMDVYVVIQG